MNPFNDVQSFEFAIAGMDGNEFRKIMQIKDIRQLAGAELVYETKKPEESDGLEIPSFMRRKHG